MKTRWNNEKGSVFDFNVAHNLESGLIVKLLKWNKKKKEGEVKLKDCFCENMERVYIWFSISPPH